MENENNNIYSEFEIFLLHSIMKLKQLNNTKDLNFVKNIFNQIMEKKYILNNVKVIEDFVEIKINLLNELNIINNFAKIDIVVCCNKILSCICNLTDSNEKFAISVLQSPLLSLLIYNIVDIPYEAASTDPNHFEFLKLSLCIIHNISRFAEGRGKLRNDKLITVICNIIDSDLGEEIHLISMMILASLVDEKDLHLLEKGRNTLKTIIELINKAYLNKTKRYIGYSVWELVLALENISVNDNMNKNIVEEKGVEIVICILNNPFCDKCVEECLGVIWNLCFDAHIRIMLMNDFNLSSTLEKFKLHESTKIRKLATSILWSNDTNSKKSKNNNLKAESFDVFLSYAWPNKKLVLSIYENLIKSNIKVWIDEIQMKSSILEDMAKGIEDSAIFIMALSDSYRISPNCRLEAEYAFSLKKQIIPVILELKYKPKGWLGIITGNKMYHEFSERRVFHETYTKLLGDIKVKLKKEKYDIEGKIEFKSIPNLTESPTQSVNFDVKSWTYQDVEQWLIANDLDQLKSRFSSLNGRLLLSMINLISKSPKYVYEILFKEFGMKFIDIVKFNAAINDLNCENQ